MSTPKALSKEDLSKMIVSAMKIATEATKKDMGGHPHSIPADAPMVAIPMATAFVHAALRDGEFSREIRDILLSTDK